MSSTADRTKSNKCCIHHTKAKPEESHQEYEMKSSHQMIWKSISVCHKHNNEHSLTPDIMAQPKD